MVDFSGLICSKPFNTKNNFNPKLDTNNTEYKAIMEKALEQRRNIQQPKQKSLSNNVDSRNSEIDKSAYRDNEGKENNVLKLGNDQRYPIINPEESRKTEEKDIDSKDLDTNVKNLTDSILAMMAGLLNIDQKDIKEIKDTLYNEINHSDSIKLTEIDIIGKISAIIENNELLGKAEIDKAINLIKSLDSDKAFPLEEQDDSSILPNNGKELVKLDNTEKLNNTKILDGIMKNSEVKTVKVLETDEAKSHNIDANNEEVKDIEIKLSYKPDLIDDTYRQKGLKVELQDTEFADTHDDLNNLLNNVRTEYSAINAKDFNTVNTPESLQKSSAVYITEFVNREELFDQILKIREIANDESISELSIKLKPDTLGKLSIRLIMENGELTARFVAENQKVKETIESNFTELKDALVQKGINIQNLSVSIGNEGKWGYEENQNLRAWYRNSKRSSYVGDVEAESEDNLTAYSNPYNINEGYLDIRV